MDTGSYPDVIDPGRKKKFATKKHPLAQNPAYPEFQPQAGHKASSYDEFLASGEYQDIVKKLNSYAGRLLGKDFKLGGRQDLFPLFQTFMTSLNKVKALEKSHRPALEKMAVDLVLDLPEFKAYREPIADGALVIRAKLQSSVKIPTLEEVDPEHDLLPKFEVQAAEIAKDLDLEVAKRRFINAMTQGSATSRNYAFHLVDDKLRAIDPSLVNLYGFVTAFAELQYFVVPDEAMFGGGGDGSGGEAAGFSRVTTEDGVPVIHAEAINFPVLVQEIIKGLMELTSRKGLPNDPKAMRHVVAKADLEDGETYSIILGRPLWRKILSQLELNEHDMAMFLYDKLVSMPAAEFNANMKAIQTGGAGARKVIQQLINEIKVDMEAENRDDFEESSPSNRLLNVLVEDIPQERVNFLKKRAPKHKDAEIQKIAASMDPTPGGKYMEWILRQIERGDIRLGGEDDAKTKESLERFMALSKKGRFTGSHNILEYKTWGDLAEVLAANAEVKGKAEEVRHKSAEGTRLLAKHGSLELYEVSTVEAATTLFKGTSWCVKDPRFSENTTYLGGGNNFLYVEKSGAQYALVHPASGQAKDTFDRGIKDSVAKELAPLFEEHYSMLKPKGEIEVLYLMAAPESMRAKDPELGYYYALKIVKGKFPEAEPVIAKSTRFGYLYAEKVLKKPWPEAEAAIAKDATYAYNYAKSLLVAPFPAGEAAIAQEPQSAYWYWFNILLAKKTKPKSGASDPTLRWPEGEAAIIGSEATKFWYQRVTGLEDGEEKTSSASP